MIHDIAHCSEKNCPKANSCVRYLAYLELKKYPGKYGKYHDFLLVKRKPCKHYEKATESEINSLK